MIYIFANALKIKSKTKCTQFFTAFAQYFAEAPLAKLQPQVFLSMMQQETLFGGSFSSQAGWGALVHSHRVNRVKSELWPAPQRYSQRGPEATSLLSWLCV